MDIVAGLTALNQTLKLSKELRDLDGEIDKSDLKKRIIDLTDGLLDAKQALQEARETELALRTEIENLKAPPKFEDKDGCLFELDGNGSRIGEPFCELCYVKTDKLIRLKFVAFEPEFDGDFVFSPSVPQHYQCRNCKNRVGENL